MKNISVILDEANKNILSLTEHFANSYFRNIMDAAYIPEKKFLLPEGDPPFVMSPNHMDQVSGVFWQVAKKLNMFQRSDIKPFRREVLFIQALESLSPVDAKILLCVKDQNLTKLYPNLTKEALVKIGYFKQ